MPKENVSTKAKTKKADAVMENQLEIPDFKFGQPVNKQPEVNVQVVFEKPHYDREEREDKFIMYSFVVMMTILNFIILAKQIW